ncbi:MAG: HAD family hydrolase [Euryarchaeota archaeon]|nr:HAD family hydrolase [Euryarchaeota archaeon]
MIRLVIFDLDETVVHNTVPFSEIRKRIMNEINCDESPPHLYEFLKEKGEEYLKILEREEIRRAKSATVDPEFPAIVEWLKSRGINVAILTRNSRRAAELALSEYINKIDALICRDDGFPPKPAPDAVFYLMHRFSANPDETVVVGDYDYDIEAGRRAGCITVRIGTGEADFSIDSLNELKSIVSPL